MSEDRLSDTWERGSPYESYIGRWSRGIAPLFLAWLDQPQHKRWLDVGCGTGALCAAILDRAAPSHLVGVEPSVGFLELAASNLGHRAQWRAGSAAARNRRNSGATCRGCSERRSAKSSGAISAIAGS